MCLYLLAHITTYFILVLSVPHWIPVDAIIASPQTEGFHQTGATALRATFDVYAVDTVTVAKIDLETSQWCDMSVMVCQITCNSIVCTTACSSKKIYNVCIIGLCEGNLPLKTVFPSQSTSNAANISTPLCHISWCINPYFYYSHFHVS